MTKLGFYSTAALERGLDGGEDRFASYFFALYHCSPDEPAGINELRERLKQEFPAKVIDIGRRFVLCGEPAFRALTAYYHALTQAETLSEDFRAYAAQRVEEITKAHRDSQTLPVPIDLTEGQLAQDHRLEFLTCTAINNGQVFWSEQDEPMRFQTPLGDVEFTIPDEWWRFAEASRLSADSESYYPYTLTAQGVQIVALRDIEPPQRDNGIPPFKKYKLVPVLLAFHSPECELPPLEVTVMQA